MEDAIIDKNEVNDNDYNAVDDEGDDENDDGEHVPKSSGVSFE